MALKAVRLLSKKTEILGYLIHEWISYCILYGLVLRNLILSFLPVLTLTFLLILTRTFFPLLTLISLLILTRHSFFVMILLSSTTLCL